MQNQKLGNYSNLIPPGSVSPPNESR